MDDTRFSTVQSLQSYIRIKLRISYSNIQSNAGYDLPKIVRTYVSGTTCVVFASVCNKYTMSSVCIDCNAMDSEVCVCDNWAGCWHVGGRQDHPDTAILCVRTRTHTCTCTRTHTCTQLFTHILAHTIIYVMWTCMNRIFKTMKKTRREVDKARINKNATSLLKQSRN